VHTSGARSPATADVLITIVPDWIFQSYIWQCIAPLHVTATRHLFQQLSIWIMFAAISEGTGWGCISANGEETLSICANTTLPAVMTGLSNVDICR